MTAPLIITLHYLASGGEVHVNANNICWVHWRTLKFSKRKGCTDIKFMFDESTNENYCEVRETPEEIMALIGEARGG